MNENNYLSINGRESLRGTVLEAFLFIKNKEVWNNY